MSKQNKTKEYLGVCPVCKEWTEVDLESNGCCNRGCYCEGSLVTIEDLLEDQSYQTESEMDNE